VEEPAPAVLPEEPAAEPADEEVVVSVATAPPPNVFRIEAREDDEEIWAA
jgi:hypothetical protein